MATLATLSAGLNHNGRPIVTPVGSEVVSDGYKYSLAAALADDDVIEVGWLPAEHVLIPSLISIRCDELDTDGSPALLLNLGVYIDGTLDEDSIIDGLTTGAAYNAQIGPTAVAAFDDIGWSASDRKIVITVDQDPTAGATEGDIFVEWGYRAKAWYDTLTDT